MEVPEAFDTALQPIPIPDAYVLTDGTYHEVPKANVIDVR